jgi:hypothetical protein
MSNSQIPLLRCTVCRHWYRPSITATSFQKTCSIACRRRRRRRLARCHREHNLQDYRVDERTRQRASRRRRKKKKVAVAQGETKESGDLSRAGLQPQVADLERFVRQSVDKALKWSRPTLIRQLTALLRDNQANRGQETSLEGLGHAPAYIRNYVPERG